jgi:hypothetical protein
MLAVFDERAYIAATIGVARLVPPNTVQGEGSESES